MFRAEPKGADEPWGGPELIIGWVGAQLAAGVAVALTLAATDVESLDELSVWALLPGQLALSMVMVAAVLAAWWRARGELSSLGVSWRTSEVLGGLGLGVVLQLVVVPLVYVPLSPWVGEDEVAERARDLAERAEGWGGALGLILMVVVLAPVVEELFYRGLLLRWARSRMGTVSGVALSALLFGLVHFQLVTLPALVLLGVVLAVLVVRTGRLGAAIAAHVSFNAVAVFQVLS